MCECFAHKYVDHIHAGNRWVQGLGTQGLDRLELELKTVGSHHRVLETRPTSSVRATSALNYRVISLQPPKNNSSKFYYAYIKTMIFKYTNEI